MTSTTNTSDRTVQVPWAMHDMRMVVAGIVCGMLGLNVLLLIINAEKIFDALAHRSVFTLTIFLAQEAVFVIPLYYFVLKKYRVREALLGFKKIPIKVFVFSLFRAFGMVFLFNVMLFLLMFRLGIPIPGAGPQESHMPLFGGSAIDIVIAAIVLVVLAPLVEELVFRGFLLQTFMQKFSPAVSSLIAAAIFALIHFEFGSIVIIFFLGLVLNWLFIRTRSIFPCIAFHVINNGLAFYLEWLLASGKLPLS